jgi:hypothetical protein
MHDDQLAAIDDWIEKQGTRICRPEAILRLVGDRTEDEEMMRETPSSAAQAQRDPEIQREISKLILEALKNLVLLGALKYVADKANSVALEMLFILGATAFWAYYCRTSQAGI